MDPTTYIEVVSAGNPTPDPPKHSLESTKKKVAAYRVTTTDTCKVLQVCTCESCRNIPFVNLCITMQTYRQRSSVCTNGNIWRKDPSVHVWHYRPYWALASLKKRLHFSLSPCRLLHSGIRRICNSPFWTTSSHLVIIFPTDHALWNFPLRTILGSFHVPFLLCDPPFLVF